MSRAGRRACECRFVRPQIRAEPARSWKVSAAHPGLVLTNRCNLRCRHCRVEERGPMDLDFAEVVAAIDAFHREGGRCLYLEGGEPFLWHDGEQGLDDVVAHAHRSRVSDRRRLYQWHAPHSHRRRHGLCQCRRAAGHPRCPRGKSFDRIMGNIRDSAHPSLYVNYTINNRNKDEIAPVLRACPRHRARPRHLLLLSYALLRVRMSSTSTSTERRRILEQLAGTAEELPHPEFAGGTAIRLAERLETADARLFGL